MSVNREGSVGQHQMSWLVVGALVLAGCSASVGGERWIFEKPGVSAAELDRDRRECFSRSINAAEPDVAVPSLGFVRVDRTAYTACMEARGYALRVDRQ